MKITYLRPLSRQRGATAVEFAIVASLTFLLLIGIMELGRVLFYMNSAAQATRVGARIAVVCDLNARGIEEQMNQWLHLLQPENIVVAYNPSGCDRSSCESVTVSIDSEENPVYVDTVIPFLPEAFTVQIPPFTTTLPRESMDSTDNEQICS